MMHKLWRWLTAPSLPPGEPEESDRFFGLEQATHAALAMANAELLEDPLNHYLESARNHLSDAYVFLWRASQQYYREAG